MSEVQLDDLFRVMIVCYGLLAVGLNVRNLWLIRHVGQSYFRTTARASAVMAGFAVVTLVGQLDRLHQPLSWRLPALFVCFSGYLWVQLVVLTQVDEVRLDADRSKRLRRRHRGVM